MIKIYSTQYIQVRIGCKKFNHPFNFQVGYCLRNLVNHQILLIALLKYPQLVVSTWKLTQND